MYITTFEGHIKANIELKPLFESEGCHGNVTTPPPGNSTTQSGPPPANINSAARQGYAAGALAVAVAASLLAFY